jgi:hypothetical protein
MEQPGRRAFLLLGQAGAEEFGLPAVQFYCSKGLLAKVGGPARPTSRSAPAAAAAITL